MASVFCSPITISELLSSVATASPLQVREGSPIHSHPQTLSCDLCAGLRCCKSVSRYLRRLWLMWITCASSLLTTRTIFRRAPDSLNGTLIDCNCHASGITQALLLKFVSLMTYSHSKEFWFIRLKHQPFKHPILEQQSAATTACAALKQTSHLHHL